MNRTQKLVFLVLRRDIAEAYVPSRRSVSGPNGTIRQEEVEWPSAIVVFYKRWNVLFVRS